LSPIFGLGNLASAKGVSDLIDGTKIQVRFTGASTVVGSNSFTTAVGGSILGVSPVVYSQKLNFLAVSPSIAAACSGDPLVKATCDEASPGVLSPAVPHFGITDLYPAAFILQNARAATGGVGSDQISKMTIKPGPIQIFNTPVTKSMRNGLQDSQVKSGGLAATCTTDATTRELGSCTPTISGPDIAKIFGGKVTRWNQVDPNLDTNKLIYTFRRENGSGPQATLNLVGMSAQYTDTTKAYPCVGGANPAELNLANTTVVSSRDEMVSALNDAEAAGKWAIGLLDVTKNGAGTDAAPSASFRYLKVDGVAPTLSNVASGAYKFIAQSTLNRLTPFPGLAQELAIVNAITTALGDPTVAAKSNTSTTLKQNFGQGGYMVVSSTSCTSDSDCAANPATKYRFASNPAASPIGYCSAPSAF
jgi:ABC-type phosphate transport system substrate-binding protein